MHIEFRPRVLFPDHPAVLSPNEQSLADALHMQGEPEGLDTVKGWLAQMHRPSWIPPGPSPGFATCESRELIYGNVARFAVPSVSSPFASQASFLTGVFVPDCGILVEVPCMLWCSSLPPSNLRLRTISPARSYCILMLAGCFLASGQS